MSSRAIGWAFDQAPTGGTVSKLLLVALADFANHDDEAWPSVATIARRCQVGRSTVLAHLAKLEADGLITRRARFTERRQISSVYRLLCSAKATGPTEKAVYELEGSTSGTGNGVHDAEPSSVRPGPVGSTSGTQNQLLEPTTEPLTTARASATIEQPSTALAVRPLPALARGNKDSLVARLVTVLDEVNNGTRARISTEQRRKLQAGIIFAYWIAKYDHPRAMLDEKRERVLMRRLEENGENVGELLYALDGARRDRWVMGTAPGADHPNDGVDFILRDRGRVEQYAALAKGYRDGTPHPLAEKYAAVLREHETGGAQGAPAGSNGDGGTVVNAGVAPDPAGAPEGGTDDRRTEGHGDTPGGGQ